MNAEVQKITLNLPANAEYVDIVRLNLYGIASKMGFTYEEIEDMKVAVSEACNNTVLYAYGQEGGMVEVVYEVTSESLSITVRDEGESFESDDNADGRGTLHDKELSEVQIGGLGFYLMEALMDEVSVTNQRGKGTQVILTKRLAKSEELV
ncbi:serine/threonine-protein kinase RsbW [Paenibacillus uliginis N3/975]|uniref:Serine/threonine-protein kinase RsbW n=1 Tax=Paenibacillus uliginis N3/975 TaxID=1313296 RepID=A0A1X7GK30_9BACL|nr:anti-sigma B factor RsbW [Paenibacillus uliginis]SMF70955.1 serine/threonine-protein kinase RsbW [Paenibacillus uliginis N3/975]